MQHDRQLFRLSRPREQTCGCLECSGKQQTDYRNRPVWGEKRERERERERERGRLGSHNEDVGEDIDVLIIKLEGEEG